MEIDSQTRFEPLTNASQSRLLPERFCVQRRCIEALPPGHLGNIYEPCARPEVGDKQREWQDSITETDRAVSVPSMADIYEMETRSGRKMSYVSYLSCHRFYSAYGETFG